MRPASDHWVNLAQSAIDRHNASLCDKQLEKIGDFKCVISQIEQQIVDKKDYIKHYLTCGFYNVNSVVLASLESDLKRSVDALSSRLDFLAVKDSVKMVFKVNFGNGRYRGT